MDIFNLYSKQVSFVVLLTVHHGTSMSQHQIDTLSLVCLLRVNASTCFGRYWPIFRRLCTVAIWWNRNLHAVNIHATHLIIPNSICAEPPEDGPVTPETCRGIDS
jgi:hypothetical protein